MIHKNVFEIIFDMNVCSFSDSARDVAIYPESVLYMLYEGDMFSCSARGNPEPSFKWNKIAGNGNPESMEGPQLILTSSMVGQNVYECIAMNLVNGTMHNVTTQVSFTGKFGIRYGHE